MADPYGVDFALTPDGDLAVEANGALGTVSGLANVSQALRLRMLTTPGELPMHPTYGSDLQRKLVGSKADPLVAVTVASNELRRLVEEDTRFVAATGIQVRTAADQPNVEGVTVTLALAGGEQLTVQDLTTPRVDEIDFADAPTLADFTDDPTIETVDGESIAAVGDDLPELEEFLAAADGTTDEEA